MKSVFKIAFLLGGILFLNASCERCYDCHMEIIVNGQKEFTPTERHCTNDRSDIEELEEDGYFCIRSGF